MCIRQTLIIYNLQVILIKSGRLNFDLMSFNCILDFFKILDS